MPKIVLYPLGSVGWIPSHASHTTCFAFFHGDELIILDAGTGLSRLMNLRDNLFKAQWSRLKHVRVFLSHYHIDHAAGLFWIKGIFGNRPITIYGPGEEVYGIPSREILDGLFRKPYSPHKLSEFGPNIRIEDIPLSGISPDGSKPLAVRVRHNRNHSDPSLAYRFDDLFAFVTDTPPEDEVVEFVRGVEVLLHESWYNSVETYESENDKLERHGDGPHTGSFGAGLIAHRAGVRRLYLIHPDPGRSSQNIEEDAKAVSERLGLDCRYAKDLQEIAI